MDYDKAVGAAFAYARHSKAVLAYLAFVGAVAALGILVVSLLFSRFGLRTAIATALHNPASLTIGFIGIIAVVAIFVLGILGLNGTVIRNATQTERLSQSWEQFSPRLGSLVALLFIAATFSFGINLVFDWLAAALPYGARAFSALNILVSIMLWFFLAFAEYAVVLDGVGPMESIRRSVKLASNKPAPALIAIIVASGTSLIMILVTVITIILLAIPTVFLARTIINGPLGVLALALGIISLGIGIFFGEVMKLHIMAHAFLDLNKSEKITKEVTGSKPTIQKQKTTEKPSKKNQTKRTNAAKKTQTKPAAKLARKQA